MTTSSSSQRNNYIPEIDGLRAVAVIGVMLFHLDSALLPGGFAGVDVFFVISGYVVSRAMVSRSGLPFLRYLADFFARRFVRILPALVVCLSVVSVLSVLFIPESWLSSSISKTGLWAYFGASNFALLLFQDGYFSPRAEYNPFTHTWSLGVEEQFYLVLPLVLWLWTAGRGVGGLVSLLAKMLLPGLVVLSLLAAFLVGRENPAAAYYLLPSRFWELGAGVMLFLLQHRGAALAATGRASTAAMGAGVALVAAGLWLSDGAHFPFPWALLPVAGTLFCLYAVSGVQPGESWFHRLFRHSVVVYIGRISYSLYLWHWPVYALFRWTVGLEAAWMPLAVLITLLCSALSYHLVEQPARNSRRLKKQFPIARIGAGLVLVAGLAWLSATTFSNREKLSLSVTRDTYTWYPYDYPIHNLPEDNKPLHGKKLLVIGNSHADAYRTMLREASDRLGVEVSIIHTDYCNTGNLLLNSGNDPVCRKQVDDIMDRVRRELSSGDMVFFASLRTYRLIDQWGVFDFDSVTESSQGIFSDDHPLNRLGKVIEQVNDSARLRAGRQADAGIFNYGSVFAYSRSPYARSRLALALEEGSELIAGLETLGIKVLVDAPKPVFQIPPYRCSDWFNRHNAICVLGSEVDKAALLELRQPVMASLAAIAERFENVILWDPFPVLCPGRVCSVYDHQGLPLFFDGDHLSAHGNRRLYPDFERVLLESWNGYGRSGVER